MPSWTPLCCIWLLIAQGLFIELKHLLQYGLNSSYFFHFHFAICFNVNVCNLFNINIKVILKWTAILVSHSHIFCSLVSHLLDPQINQHQWLTPFTLVLFPDPTICYIKCDAFLLINSSVLILFLIRKLTAGFSYIHTHALLRLQHQTRYIYFLRWGALRGGVSYPKGVQGV